MFVAKLKADGSGFEYITYIGGSGGDGESDGYVGGLAVDPQGNVYVAGVTGSPDFPTTTGAYQTMSGSQFECDDDPNAGLCGDAFVLKLSPAGTLIYSTFLGGSDYDAANAIAVDSTGAAYITGVTASPDFPATSAAYQARAVDVDAFVAKISPDGSRLMYSTLIGGTGADAGTAIVVDRSGRAHIAGLTEATDFPLKNPLQSSFGEPWDGFVSRLNADGSEIEFSTYLGGSATDEALAIALDGHDDMYLVGYTNSPDFLVRKGFQKVLGGPDGNGFVTKIAADGSRIVYSTFLGGADGTTVLNAIAVEGTGNVYVAGFGGSDFPIVNSTQPYGGSSDAVVAKITADGSAVMFSSYVGGSEADVATGIAVDNSGRVIITGQTSSSDFPVSVDAFQRVEVGPSDAFLVKLEQQGSEGPIFSAAKLIAIGPVYVGQTSDAMSLPIVNAGDRSLIVSGIAGSTNVQVNSSCGIVAPGQACFISAQLVTNAAGDQFGTVTIYDNAPDSPQTIFVRGTGVYGGDLELSSLLTDAAFNYYGKTAVPITAMIFNRGPYDSEDVVIRVTSDAGRATCEPCYVGRVAAGKTAVFRFNFVPDTYGMATPAVEVQPSSSTPDLDGNNNRESVAIANPRYGVDRSEVSFPEQIVNLTSDSERVVFTALDEQALQLTFSSTGDFVVSAMCDSTTFQCYADLLFTPTSEGLRDGTLVITEPLAGTRQEIKLVGTGIRKPHLQLSESEMSFVNGITGSPGTPRPVTLTNDGSAPLFVVTITTEGDFVQTNQCPASLMPGQSCTVLVSFSPLGSGMSSGSLTIIHNGPALVDKLSLKGIGVPLANLSRPIRPTKSDAGTAMNGDASEGILQRPERPGGRQRSRRAR
jgi:hypothetical protein